MGERGWAWRDGRTQGAAGGRRRENAAAGAKQPEAARFAVEVPAIEKRRAGFDADRRLWIIFDEFNTDIVGNSFYLEPEPPTGRFSKAFFLLLLREFIRRRKSATEVSRFR